MCFKLPSHLKCDKIVDITVDGPGGVKFGRVIVNKLAIRWEMLRNKFNFIDVEQSLSYTIKNPVLLNCRRMGSEHNVYFCYAVFLY